MHSAIREGLARPHRFPKRRKKRHALLTGYRQACEYAYRPTVPPPPAPVHRENLYPAVAWMFNLQLVISDRQPRISAAVLLQVTGVLRS